jgi:hypothetical protein
MLRIAEDEKNIYVAEYSITAIEPAKTKMPFRFTPQIRALLLKDKFIF